MKTTALLLIILSTLLRAQGPLTPPPGPPAPTMKTLDQIEPRRPLVVGTPGVTINIQGGITISQPGSYYLTNNLTVSDGTGIQIISSKVTLDLNGFTISSTAPPTTHSAIWNLGHEVTITNGHISGGTSYFGGTFTHSIGFSYGITSMGYINLRITHITIRGMQLSGILTGSTAHNSIIESCIVQTCGNIGILAACVHNSIATEIGGTAIESKLVTNSRASSVGSTAILAETVTNSSGTTSTNNCWGIFANTVSGSSGYATGAGSGIFAYSVHNCYGESTGSASSSHGISGDVVSNSRGRSFGDSGGPGIVAYESVTNCSGFSSRNHGIESWNGFVTASYGITTSQTDNFHGIFSNAVSNSRGIANGTGSGNGIDATLVTDSIGYANTASVHGINAALVTNSFGHRQSTSADKYGIRASQANNCRAENNHLIDVKFNTP